VLANLVADGEIVVSSVEVVSVVIVSADKNYTGRYPVVWTPIPMHVLVPIIGIHTDVDLFG